MHVSGYVLLPSQKDRIGRKRNHQSPKSPKRVRIRLKSLNRQLQNFSLQRQNQS